MIAIYGLVDPRDRKVFYVGQSKDVYKRFVEHISCSGNNFERNARILNLRSLNLMVIMEVFEVFAEQEDANEREGYWVRHFEVCNHPLSNILLLTNSNKKKERVVRSREALKKIAKVFDISTGGGGDSIDNGNVDGLVVIGRDNGTKEPVYTTKNLINSLIAATKSGRAVSQSSIQKMIGCTEQHAKNISKLVRDRSTQ